jgi:hypothetical protein
MSQMLAVTEPGGVVMLQHLRNEGERQGYDGLHAWNFTARDGRLVVCRPAESWFVDEHLDDVRVVTLEEGDWVTAYLRKLAD